MLLIFTILYFLSLLLYHIGLNSIASIITICLAIFLYIIEFISKKRLVNVRGFFALGFIGGFGLSLLKLSNLSSDYSMKTFLAIYVAFFSLYVGGFFASKKDINAKKNILIKKINKIFNTQDILLIFIMLITFISFVVEATKLGFIPLFVKDTPHAYSTFHVFGLHYITTLYVFIPSIALCNYFMNNKNKKDRALLVIAYLYLLILAILMVSRGQLIMGLVLSLFTYIINNKKNLLQLFSKKIYKKQNIIIMTGIIIVFIIIYIVITINRAHDITYLKDIFDMKNKNIPIFITQPYMYIAHNFENLNYMINNIFRFTFGRRILYPLFTLTLVKKYFPLVVESPYYIIKEELSTVSLIYDFYYDFGIVGVIVFCFIIGYIGKSIEDKVYDMIDNEIFYKNNYSAILMAIFSYYMMFSFFQAYFSLVDTWIHIILLSLLASIFVMTKSDTKKMKKEKNSKISDNKKTSNGIPNDNNKCLM